MNTNEQKNQFLSVGKKSAAALIAGTGLGFGVTADAAIVNGNVGISLDPWDTTENYSLDINGDGIDDFNFSASYSPQGYSFGYNDPNGYYVPGYPIPNFGGSSVVATGTNQVTSWGPLAAGAPINGSRTDFAGSSQLGYTDYYSDVGLWSEFTTGYLGLQFDVGGQTHYGWILLGIGFEAQLDLFDFGYETSADTEILAGASAVPIPAMTPLFAAALGAMGVTGFRRKKREARLN